MSIRHETEAELSARILKDIISKPEVLWVARQNGGAIRPGFWSYSLYYSDYKERTHSGMPDIHGQLDSGRWFGIEVKTIKGVISDNQYLFHNKALNTTIVRTFEEYQSWYSELRQSAQ